MKYIYKFKLNEILATGTSRHGRYRGRSHGVKMRWC